jgi:hypothetical protein
MQQQLCSRRIGTANTASCVRSCLLSKRLGWGIGAIADCGGNGNNPTERASRDAAPRSDPTDAAPRSDPDAAPRSDPTDAAPRSDPTDAASPTDAALRSDPRDGGVAVAEAADVGVVVWKLQRDGVRANFGRAAA